MREWPAPPRTNARAREALAQARKAAPRCALNPQSENAAATPQGAPQPIAMRTFRDYGVDFGWFAHCRTCFRDRPFTDTDIARLFGLDADVDQVRGRLRCARCGARDCLLYRYYRGGMRGPGETAYPLVAPP